MWNVTALILLGKKKKKLSQLRYHPSFPAYGALSPSVGGSTWHFQAGLITHLPSQLRARQTCGAAPKPWQLSWHRFVEKSSPRLLWVNICKAAEKSGCWSCSRHHKPKISISVAFRPRLALTRLVYQKTIKVSLVSSRVEWIQKSLCKCVVLLIYFFFFWVSSNSIVLLHLFSQKGLPRAVTYTLREKLLFAL